MHSLPKYLSIPYGALVEQAVRPLILAPRREIRFSYPRSGYPLGRSGGSCASECKDRYELIRSILLKCIYYICHYAFLSMHIWAYVIMHSFIIYVITVTQTMHIWAYVIMHE